jgi:hypothetical protein
LLYSWNFTIGIIGRQRCPEELWQYEPETGARPDPERGQAARRKREDGYGYGERFHIVSGQALSTQPQREIALVQHYRAETDQ